MESPVRCLPTPPGTSHRAEKENRSSHFTHVAWSERNEIHTLSATLGRGKPLKSSGLRQQPGRSILKKVQVPLPSMDECQRETTPEPSDPLVDLTYLESSVKAIIATEIVLKDLVEAYNTLTLRIRACVAGNTDADASWPLFQPIRKNREAFVDALVRDLGRALEKPLSQTVEPESDEECKMIEDVEEPCEDAFKGLPSPKESPKKKRKGMSAEQVKHARDLCTTCHATLKFLSAVFTIPAVYRLFKEKQLRFVLTHVLAIPLAEALPTPNARKTYALAIFLIQTQRLPDEVLEPAANRIAYAIRRGIEGELGKEGKKGSINDGLKAVHDLATTYPAIFVPAFTELLPSVFACLLGPTYAIRTQSCSALGGFAIASASIPLSPVHTRISAYTALYLTDVPPGTPSKKGSPMDDSAIVRTLRMLLKTSDPVVAAQGPVWALCLMASFVVMLRKAVYSNAKVTPIFVALFNVGLHHPKSSVRGLVTAVWRTMTWAYFTPPLMKLPSSDDEVEEEDAEEDMDTQEAETRYGKLWKVLSGVTEMGNGVSSVGALLSTETEDNLRRAVYVMKRMGRNGGAACKDAMDLVCQLVSQGAENEWEPMKLLPNALFSTNPGLLTAEYNELAQAVRPILARFPGVEDVRALTDEELSQPWVFMGLLNVWMEGLRNLRLFWGCKELPEEIHEVWLRLLQVNVKTLTEAENDAELRRLADGVVTVLCDILDEEDLDLSSGVDDTNSNVLPTIPIELQASPGSWRKLALKSFVVEQLWIVVRDTVPRDVLAEPTETFLAYLIQHEPHLVPDVLQADQAHASWAQLCATVALTCETAEVEAFFGGRRCSADKKKSWEWVPAVRSQVWSQFIKVWDDRQVNWESGVLLLAVPFSSSSSWELDNEDLNSWDGYLRYTMDKALDYGVDSVAVLDQVAATILADHSPTHTSSTRVADMLLSHLDISDARQVPTGMFEFVNETLTSSYPPDQRNVITSMWLLRTLTRLIDECPVELSENVLELLQEGLSAWISDEFSALTVQEYELDILALYQTVLMRMRSLSLSLPTLETLSPVLCAAFIGRSDKPDGAKEAFSEYWQATYDLRQDLVESLPEKVVMALDILHNRSEASSLAHLVLDDTASVGEVDDMLVPESEDEDETEPSTPKAKTRDLASAFFPRQASAQDGSSANPFEIMSTPPSSSCSSPPRRPHKTPKVFDLTSDTPPTSPSRAPPVTPTKKSPEHRRTSSGRSMPNKENVSPLPVFDSIAERIAASISPGPSTLGKRRAPDEEADDSLKRHKRSESLSMMFQEGASPEMMPDGDVPSTPNRALPPRLRKMAIMGSPRLTQTLPTMKSKRRNKSVFMDAVEIASTPGLRKRSSQESISSVDSKRATIPLRRTRSSTRLAENAVIPVAGPSTRKRRRGSFDADDHAVQTPSKRSVTASSSRSSSPSRSTFDPIAFGSDDSIMMATPSRARSPMQDMSSDDDPHIGQVTPHRLVSPAMRRVQNDDSDPPSDDSVLAASPTRDHVARRRSAGKAMIEKLAPLMLGKHHRTQSKDLTSGFFKSPRRE